MTGWLVTTGGVEEIAKKWRFFGGKCFCWWFRNPGRSPVDMVKYPNDFVQLLKLLSTSTGEAGLLLSTLLDDFSGIWMLMCMPGNNLYFYANLYIVISILVLQNHGQNALPPAQVNRTGQHASSQRPTDIGRRVWKGFSRGRLRNHVADGVADVICWLIDGWACWTKRS